MKEFFRREPSRANALSVTVIEKALEHVTIRVQPISPGSARENLPLLVETLVDRGRPGTCYRAANWLALGLTAGRGRQDRTHARHGAAPKTVLVYPLVAAAGQRLRAG